MSSRANQILQLLGGAAVSANQENYLDENTAILQTAKQLSKTPITANDEAEISQWLSFSRNSTVDAAQLDYLNGILATRSYLVGESFSVADASVLYKLHADSVVAQVSNFQHVRRWLDHVQAVVPQNVVPVVSFPPVSLPLFTALQQKVTAAAAPSATESKAADASPASSKAAAPAPVVEEKKKDKESKKKEEVKVVEEKKADVEVADPSKLDIRVGLVVRCWNHPDSEKLLCEEIDLGEGSNRQIASGIRAFYTAEEVQGRKVLVLANLKERSIAGFKSQGMVLCASSADKSVVKLLEAPAVAQVGDRVDFAGFSGEAATPAQVAKKKIFETLAPLVRYHFSLLPLYVFLKVTHFCFHMISCVRMRRVLLTVPRLLSAYGARLLLRLCPLRLSPKCGSSIKG